MIRPVAGNRPRLLLMIHGTVGGLLMAAALALPPSRLNSGPSMVVLYDLASARSWAGAWLVVAAGCWWARDRPGASAIALAVLAGMSMLWATGLIWPWLTDGRTNLLAAVPWCVITLSSLCIAREHWRRP